MSHERPILTARLVRSVPLSGETKHLEFAVEEVPRFDFTAGQFVSMREPHDGREMTRAYSIASPPRADNTFDLCLNRVLDGFFSNFLCDLAEGARIRFHGPHGYFALKSPVRDSLFIGTGTGIAPLRGMLQWLLADESRHLGREFWLIFGVRYEGDLYYNDEFLQLAREHPTFHYLPTLSRENPGWTGGRGYVQEHVRRLAQGRSDMDAYICGLKDMVLANRDLLKGLGWDKKSILYERFD
ncbi:MAG: FAD-dependent oxidoreductase [Acidobacteriia bacterium]|nr:FAD-dependent oxidoreductase [Terriglobia bacterium]